jgi:hypothetical protein
MMSRRLPFPTRAAVAHLAVGLLVAGCSNDPIRYIPEADRNMLQAQERLGNGDGHGSPITVEQMLRGVKAANAGAGAGAAAGAAPVNRILLRFDGDSVLPSEDEVDRLHRFALSANASSLTVSSRPGNFDDPGSPVLGQRRAIAVSRELTGLVPDVQLHFDPALPPDVVVVSRGGAGYGADADLGAPGLGATGTP